MRPRRSLPTRRTRVASVSRSESSSASSSALRRAGGAAAWLRLLFTPSSVARTDQECARISSRRRSCSAARQREQRPRVSHREPARAKVRLDELGQLEQPEAVRDAAPILAHALAPAPPGSSRTRRAAADRPRPPPSGSGPRAGGSRRGRARGSPRPITSRTTAGMRSMPGELGRPPAPLADDELIAVRRPRAPPPAGGLRTVFSDAA